MQRTVNPLMDARSLFALLLLFRRIRPDIVHCHSSKAGILGRLAARCLGIPSVYTPHGYAFLSTSISPYTQWCFRGAEWLGARLGNAIVACGQEEYGLSRQLAGQKLVICVPNALPLKELEPFRRVSSVQRTPESRRLKVGMCSRLTPKSNPELFAYLARTLQHEADWYWIGVPRSTVDEQDAPPEHVICTGWIARNEALKAVSELDI